jgi:hypothetical protein
MYNLEAIILVKFFLLGKEIPVLQGFPRIPISSFFWGLSSMSF